MFIVDMGHCVHDAITHGLLGDIFAGPSGNGLLLVIYCIMLYAR